MRPVRLLGALVVTVVALARPARAEERPVADRPVALAGLSLFVLGGVAAGPETAGAAELAGVAAARTVAAAGRWRVSVELWPLLVWRLEAEEGRRTSPAAALDGLLSFDAGPRGSAWALRLESGAGPMYATEPVPAAGSRWNFFAQAGVRAVRRGGGSSLGYRFVHVSNGTGPGPENPGLNLHAVILGWTFR